MQRPNKAQIVRGINWCLDKLFSIGWRSWNPDDEMAMPCAHPIVDLFVARTHTAGTNDLPSPAIAIAITARCRACNGDASDDFEISVESDGRIIVENGTAAPILLVVDGEMHTLAARASGVRASHVTRPFLFDDEDHTNGGKFDPQSGRGM